MDEDENKKIAYYTRFLLDGGNVKKIPYSLISNIKIVLTISKKKAISNGQRDKVKQIQRILSDLDKIDNKLPSSPNNNWYCEDQSSMLTKKQEENQLQNPTNPQSSLSLYQKNEKLPNIQRAQSKQSKKRIHSSEQLEEILESLVIGNKNEIEIDIIPELIQYAKVKIDSLVKEGKLIEAQKYETVNNQLISSTTSRYKNNQKLNKKKEYIDQLHIALKRLQDEQDKMEYELSLYDENVEQIRYLQEMDWNKQLEEYDETTNGEVPSNYKRFSQKLISLREQTNSLIKSRHFQEAAFKKIEADELEHVELLQCRENYINTRKRKRERMIEEHKKKLDCFEENCKWNRLRIINDNQNTISCIERTISILQNKIKNAQLDDSENTVYIKTPVLTPFHSAPLSPHQGKYANNTFVTQNISKIKSNSSLSPSPVSKKIPDSTPMTPKSKQVKKLKQKTDTKIMYRPVPSKWRFQTPQSMKTIKKSAI